MVRAVAVGSAGGAGAARRSRLAWFPPADRTATFQILTARVIVGEHGQQSGPVSDSFSR
jgi:hypothetical protein